MDGQYILVIAVIIIMGWFAVGVLYNLRRGEALLKWMRQGLPRIGEKTSFKWMGTSVVQMNIAQARKPFRRLETLIVLAPRDVPWLWIAAALQGRRDTLIFRAQTQTAPLVDFDLADPAAWTGRMALAAAKRRGWEQQPYHGLQLAAPAGLQHLASATADRLYGQVQAFDVACRRFSLRKGEPNLELHLAFADPKQTDAPGWFEKLRSLAQAISEPGQ